MCTEFVGIFEKGRCKAARQHGGEFGTATGFRLERDCSVERCGEAGDNGTGDCRPSDTQLSGQNVRDPFSIAYFILTLAWSLTMLPSGIGQNFFVRSFQVQTKSFSSVSYV